MRRMTKSERATQRDCKKIWYGDLCLSCESWSCSYCSYEFLHLSQYQKLSNYSNDQVLMNYSKNLRVLEKDIGDNIYEQENIE